MTTTPHNPTDGHASAEGAKPEVRPMYLAHSTDKILIGGITVGVGAFLAPRWDHTKTATGWHVHGADLGPEPGFMFGAIHYVNRADDRHVRVGCRWNTITSTYECIALHPTEPRENDTLTEEERDAVLLDARTRVGHLHRLLLEIATNVMTDTSNQALLQAAGFGTDITITHDEDKTEAGQE